jgi:citronellol/citronellal dehydrogenase
MKGKTVLITGATRGIGLAIAEKLASFGAHVSILAKEDPQILQETVSLLTRLGAQAICLKTDVRDVSQLQKGVEMTVERFGGIDALINNTSAIRLLDSLDTTPEVFDLLLSTSVRAAFFLSQACHPYLKKSANPHIIHISPPLDLAPRWFKDHLAFSIGKCAMSLCTLGMAEEFRKEEIAVNSLWPKTTIATQRVKEHLASSVYRSSRWPTIMADAAYELLKKPAQKTTGSFFIDESLLKEAGITDFSSYAVDPSAPLMEDLFVPGDKGTIPLSKDLFLS